MRFTRKEPDPLFEALEVVACGLGLTLIDFAVFGHKGGGAKGNGVTKGSVLVKLTIYKDGIVGLADCSRAHYAMLPRLELAFPDAELSVEVSSPGIDRLIKDASEFAFYKGRAIKCYRSDVSDWARGVLIDADEERLVLREKSVARGDARRGECGELGEFGELVIPYKLIAKAKLDWEE
jgi:ribosome maturation factor RimP